jgi:hypothetical protein
LEGDCPGSDSRTLLVLRVSCGEGYFDGRVSDGLASLYIGDQLLQELFTLRGALARDPLLLPIRLNRTKTFCTDRFLIGDCPKVGRETADVRL